LDSYSQKLLSEQDRKWKSGFNPDAFIFTSHPLGLEPWKPNWVTQTFIRARRTAGLDHFRLHDLRYFMATQMLSTGVAIPVVVSPARTRTRFHHLERLCACDPGCRLQAAELISGIVSPSARARLFVTNQRSGDALVSDRVV
jgi:hypothetical protein